MAELVAVRHESQGKDEDPGLMAKAYFDAYGKAKGYALATEAPAVAAAEAASGGSEPPPSRSAREKA